MRSACGTESEQTITHRSLVATRFRALVFDFDGLILETETPDFRAWNEVFVAHGQTLDPVRWAECIGRDGSWYDPVADLEILCGTSLDRAHLKARHRARHQELIAAEVVLPGVEAYLWEAGQLGLRLAVASSSSRGWVEGHLERLGLRHYFTCVRCKDDVQHAKPYPDLYLAAATCLGIGPEEAIAFEDSPNGAWAAKRAGMICVAVPNPLTAALDLDHADLRLESLTDMSLGDLLQQFD